MDTAKDPVQSDFVFVPRAAEIAREAGARLREYFIAGVETEYKGDVDLVTVADRTVEKLIRASTAGTWTRWMERPTSLMDSRSSAFRWDWSTGPRARGRIRTERWWPE